MIDLIEEKYCLKRRSYSFLRKIIIKD